ncbi:MAG: class I SAM-dependent methyltransferase [Chloroflexi bacterium]|nr:class I SAM-dependent methyltransferase [Chloroflexota bacterium]
MTDAFGQQPYDQHRGLISPNHREVGERDDGYIRVYDHPRWYFTTCDEWEPHLQKAIEYVQGRTLDMGCGAGCVTLYLQQRGLGVVGIDSSPLDIQICNERGIQDARLLSVTQINVKKLGIFDSIVLTGNNFGLFGNPVRAKRLLRRLSKMTTDNARRIIAETTDPYTTVNPVDLSYQERNRAEGRMSGQYRHRERYLNLKGAWFDWLFVSRDEMRSMVDDTGWTINKFIEPEGSQYAAVLGKVTSREIDT